MTVSYGRKHKRGTCAALSDGHLHNLACYAARIGVTAAVLTSS